MLTSPPTILKHRLFIIYDKVTASVSIFVDDLHKLVILTKFKFYSWACSTKHYGFVIYGKLTDFVVS